MYKSLIAAVCVLAPMASGAQVRCKMPNGVWIERKLTEICPSGATQAQSLDGKPLPLRLPEPAKSPPTVQERPAPDRFPTQLPNAALPSEKRAMPFQACVSLMTRTVLDLGGRTRVIVSAPDLRSIRICTNDGSVLMTCSRPDASMVATRSPHFCD